MVNPPKVEPHEITPSDEEQISTLLQQAQGTAVHPVIIAAIGTGLRRSELLGLRWCDLDLNAGFLTVRRSIESVSGIVRFKELKTKRSARTVALPAFLIAELSRYRLHQAERFLALGLGRPHS